MSALLPPRLVFRGFTSWSPSTINNLPAAYDKGRVAAATRQTEWLKGLNEDGTDVCGGWNLHGANDCAFLGVEITRIQTASGSESVSDDPLLGCSVTLAGSPSPHAKGRGAVRIVDVDPKHPITAQMFFDRLTVGDARCGFAGTPCCRSCVRWPVLDRNLNRTGGLIRAGCAAVLWQTGLPSESLQWHGLNRSPSLRALRKTMEADAHNRGLIVRFLNYRTMYYQSATWKGVRLTNPELLSAAYRDGFTGVNPAISMTLGSIGIWRSGELATGPVERLMVPRHRMRVGNSGSAGYISAQFSDRAPAYEACLDATLGPAFVALDHDRHVAVIDFGLTFPEHDAFLEKADLGDFLLQARRGRNAVAICRPITYADYCRKAYETNAGVLELPFEPEVGRFIQSARLEMVCVEPPHRKVLREEILVADSEERGIYLDQGEWHRVHVQVFERGRAVSRPVSLAFAHYDDEGEPLPLRRRIASLADGDGNPLRHGRAPVGEGGRVQVILRPLRPGFCFLSFRPFTGSGRRMPARFSPHRLPYLAVRVLPFDDDLERQTPDSHLSFEFIYDRVLKVYDVVYPAINKIFELNDGQAVAAQAEVIRAHLLLDPSTSTEYLPASRDLSAGKRRLLLRFLRPGSRKPRRRGDR
jgi:hypothetical protein